MFLESDLGATCWIFYRNRYDVLIVMPIMRAVQVTVMKVIGVSFMSDGQMTATGSVDVSMFNVWMNR